MCVVKTSAKNPKLTRLPKWSALAKTKLSHVIWVKGKCMWWTWKHPKVVLLCNSMKQLRMWFDRMYTRFLHMSLSPKGGIQWNSRGAPDKMKLNHDKMKLNHKIYDKMKLNHKKWVKGFLCVKVVKVQQPNLTRSEKHETSTRRTPICRIPQCSKQNEA